MVQNGRDSSSVRMKWFSTDMGQDGEGAHGAALPFRTEPGLGVTLAVAALQSSVLWPSRGHWPHHPYWIQEKTPWNTERVCREMDPWGTCWLQRVDARLAQIP